MLNDQNFGQQSKFWSNWNLYQKRKLRHKNSRSYNLIFRSADGLHEHTKIQIEEGPTFVIKGNLNKESLAVAVVDTEGISEKSRGIIGQFIRTDAYKVKATGEVNEDGDETAAVTAG